MFKSISLFSSSVQTLLLIKHQVKIAMSNFFLYNFHRRRFSHNISIDYEVRSFYSRLESTVLYISRGKYGTTTEVLT